MFFFYSFKLYNFHKIKYLIFYNNYFHSFLLWIVVLGVISVAVLSFRSSLPSNYIQSKLDILFEVWILYLFDIHELWVEISTKIINIKYLFIKLINFFKTYILSLRMWEYKFIWFFFFSLLFIIFLINIIIFTVNFPLI